VSPYREMHVWDARGTGSIHFDSADIGEPNLGHIVENRVTRLALWERLEDLSSVRLVCPAGVDALEPAGDRTLVRLDSGDTVRTALVVAADGTRSHIRTMAGIGTRGWAYGQQAVVASVVTERPHGATARQRFLAEGPLAFLPLNDGECSIVWSTSPQHAEALLAMEEDRFCSELGEAFGYTLGRITSTGPRASFPLRLQHARHYVQRRLALVGDAAHASHPLAGQGVNLGLMDAAALAEVLEDASARGRDPGGLDVLRRYERARKGANLGMLAVMDGFKRLFGSQQPVLRLARNFGLDVVDGAAPLKQLIIRHAMGLAGEQPRLARVNAGR
jgi:2-octaprenylphenol hydroxylase